MNENIVIKGARQNNLKNIDVTVPRDKLVVFTGLSGSGKSTLAFETIYAEGQRRYVESLSSYARMFLGQMEKPDVDLIEGLSPAISIDQKTTSHNPRSTVGTVTEIYDYMRLLFARTGVPHCPNCGREIARQTVDTICDKVMALPEGTKIFVNAPVVRGKKGEYQKELTAYKKSGYARVSIDGITVAEQAYMLDDAKTTYYVDGVKNTDGKVTVGADGDVVISVTIELTGADKDYLDANFENGMYVEGFITLDAADGQGVDLSIPYLAYYGDWLDAPIFDKTTYEVSADYYNTAIEDEDKTIAALYETVVIGRYYKGTETYIPLGQYVYDVEGGADLLETYSVLQAIVEHVGVENLASRVTYPLEGMKVVTYYGCLLSRPAHVAKFDDPENPVSLDNIMKALGAEVLPFALKTECCGAAMGIPDVNIPGSLSGRILDTAKAVGAEAVITACPLCHMNLDLRQRQAARISKKSFFGLPVFYYTQMIALAFGLPEDAMRLDKLAVNPHPLLDKIAERRRARVSAELDAMKAAGAAS